MKTQRMAQFIDDASAVAKEKIPGILSSLSTGLPLLDLGLSSNLTSIFLALSDLPPHAEFDIDAKHAYLGSVDDKTMELIAHQRTQGDRCVVAISAETPTCSGEIGFLRALSEQRGQIPLILNWTPAMTNTELNALSPLYDLFGGSFQVAHVGVQLHCSERDAIDAAIIRGEKFVFLSAIEKLGLSPALEQVISTREQRKIWIRFNLDCLRASDGGGEKSWPTGIGFSEFLELIGNLNRRSVVCGLLATSVSTEKNSLGQRALVQLLANFLYDRSYREVVSNFHAMKNEKSERDILRK